MGHKNHQKLVFYIKFYAKITHQILVLAIIKIQKLTIKKDKFSMMQQVH